MCVCVGAREEMVGHTIVTVDFNDQLGRTRRNPVTGWPVDYPVASPVTCMSFYSSFLWSWETYLISLFICLTRDGLIVG